MGQTTEAAATEEQSSVRVLSLETRLADLIPLPPIGVGLCVFVLLFGGFVLSQWAIGQPVFSYAEGSGPGLVRSARLTFLVTALIGFTAAANLYLPRSIWKDQARSLVTDPERKRALLAFDPLPLPLKTVRSSRWAGLCGIALSPGVLALWASASGDGTDGSYAAVIVLTPLLFWILARSAFQTLAGGRDVTLPVEFMREIDLFDLRPHYSKGRTGLRMALVWFAGTAITIVVLSTTGLSPVALALVVGGIGMGAVALVLPVRGHHRAVRRKKRTALDALQPQVHAALEAHRNGETENAGTLADLLALQTYLENIREWPFDNSTLVRFALYTLIPLGSWVGGALVERVLELFLS